MLLRLAPIAQSAERFHGKEKVQGSIPCWGSEFPDILSEATWRGSSDG